MSRINPIQANLTNSNVRGLIAPVQGREEIRDTEVRGLVVRVTSSGAKSWSVHRRLKGGPLVRVTIGPCDGITATVARLKAKEIIAGLAVGDPPLKRPSVLAQIAAKQARQLLTLQALTTAYADLLQSRGQESHKDARSIFRLHLLEPHPALAIKPAVDVTTGEIVDVLRAVKEKGFDRTANKLRSYLRAAYETAIASHVSHEVPVAFKAYGIKLNPAATTKADGAANKADKQPHTLAEMRAYWQLIENAPGKEGAMLRLHLLTGAQRIEQLARLQKVHITDDTITIFDKKGKGQVERAHVVPLTARARGDVQILNDGGTYLLSVTGDAPLEPTALRRFAHANGAAKIPEFKLKRLRSGVETFLASRKVSKDIRGRLQSHGVAGVQDKSYDAYEYLDEKLAALQLLEAALTSTDAKVITIRKGG
jgi:integrase